MNNKPLFDVKNIIFIIKFFLQSTPLSCATFSYFRNVPREAKFVLSSCHAYIYTWRAFSVNDWEGRRRRIIPLTYENRAVSKSDGDRDKTLASVFSHDTMKENYIRGHREYILISRALLRSNPKPLIFDSPIWLDCKLTVVPLRYNWRCDLR